MFKCRTASVSLKILLTFLWSLRISVVAGFSLTPYLESFTPTFGLGTPVFPSYIVGLLLFLKDVSGTPIFKILVRTPSCNVCFDWCIGFLNCTDTSIR